MRARSARPQAASGGGPRGGAYASVGTVVIAAILSMSALGQSSDTPGTGDDRAALRRFLSDNIASTSGFSDRYAAEAWLVLMDGRLARYLDAPTERVALLNQVHSAATQAGLSPELVLALIEVESAFDRFAVSRVGAQGLMQVMPFWKNEIGRSSDNLTNNKTNLAYGCRILQYYLEREDGALHEALAAYNGSSGSRVYSDRVARAWREHWRNEPLDWSR